MHSGDRKLTMSAQTFVLRCEADRNQLIYRLRALLFDKPWKVTIREADKRSLDANACMWAHLADISEQVEWYGHKLSPEDWKHVFTAALRRYRVVPGIDGGFVAVGMSTSAMSKANQGRHAMRAGRSMGKLALTKPAAGQTEPT